MMVCTSANKDKDLIILKTNIFFSIRLLNIKMLAGYFFLNVRSLSLNLTYTNMRLVETTLMNCERILL